jgi:GNAT superfamily N-acetyltransferase
MPSRPIVVREVRTRRDSAEYIGLPWRIYVADPCWVPPLRLEVKEFLDPQKHPFYRHGAATTFIALRDDRVVGRILASDDPNYNAAHGTNLGCFGMFESIDDRGVAHALLEAAAEWLRARGRTSILGPIDYSVNYPCGLLVDGFDTPPRFMMNHNPPYYAGLLESWGLAKAKDLYAWWFDPARVSGRWRERTQRLARRSRAVVRPFRLKDFEADFQRCLSVYNDMRDGGWGFVRLTEAEFRYFAKRIAQIAVPEQVLLAEVDGRAVGFSVTLPDLNEAMRPLNGRLTWFGLPIGLVRFLWRMRRAKTARMLVLGLIEGYRRRAIAESLILQTLDYGWKVIGYEAAELGWTLEDNAPINLMIESVGGERYKTYRIYERAIA